MTVVNTYPYVLLTKIMLDKVLNNRNKMTAIINISSSITFFPTAISQIYGCTKVFAKWWSMALEYELPKNKFDVMTVYPMYVSTNMAPLKVNSRVVTAKDYAESVLKHLGQTRFMYGPATHEF